MNRGSRQQATLDSSAPRAISASKDDPGPFGHCFSSWPASG